MVNGEHTVGRKVNLYIGDLFGCSLTEKNACLGNGWVVVTVNLIYFFNILLFKAHIPLSHTPPFIWWFSSDKVTHQPGKSPSCDRNVALQVLYHN